MSKLEEQAHLLAENALEQQERSLTELRNRAGTLITAASLIASFFGGQAFAHGIRNLWIFLGLLAFGTSLALCIYVLLPKRSLIFALDGPGAYEALYAVRGDEEEIHRRLTYWLQSFRQKNHLAMKRLTHVFELAGFALVSEMGFLAIGLALG